MRPAPDGRRTAHPPARRHHRLRATPAGQSRVVGADRAVRSASTLHRGFDLLKKAGEHRALPTLRHFVLWEPDEPRALVSTCDGEGGWTPEEVAGLDGALALDAVGVRLPMAEAYEGVAFEPSAA